MRYHCYKLGHCWTCNCHCRHRLVRWNNCREPPYPPARERKCLRGRSRCTTCRAPCRSWIRSTRHRHSCRRHRPKRCWWSSLRHFPGRSHCIPRFRPSECRSRCPQKGPLRRAPGRTPWPCHRPRRVSCRSSAHTRLGPWRRTPRFRGFPCSTCRHRRLRVAVWSRRWHSTASRMRGCRRYRAQSTPPRLDPTPNRGCSHQRHSTPNSPRRRASAEPHRRRGRDTDGESARLCQPRGFDWSRS